MSFLSRYPKRWFEINGKLELMTNISKRVVIPKSVLQRDELFMVHHVQLGDRPEMISERLYDTPDYWWLVLMVNDIYDVYTQWPLSERDLDEFITQEYADPYAIKHYVDDDGDIADPRAMMWQMGATDIDSVINTHGLTAVTHADYEYAANEHKRFIRLIDPDHIATFDEYLEKALNE